MARLPKWMRVTRMYATDNGFYAVVNIKYRLALIADFGFWKGSYIYLRFVFSHINKRLSK